MKTKILSALVATTVLTTLALAEATPVYNSKVVPVRPVARTVTCPMSANMKMHHDMKMEGSMKMGSPLKCGMSCGM